MNVLRTERARLWPICDLEDYEEDRMMAVVQHTHLLPDFKILTLAMVIALSCDFNNARLTDCKKIDTLAYNDK